MPFLLRCGMAFLAVVGAVGVLAVALILLVAPIAGTFVVDDEPATRGQFLSSALPMLLALLALAALALAIAWALWKERPWSRTAILVCWLVGLFTLPGLVPDASDSRALRSEVTTWAVLAALVWWYLYRKRAVAAYYRALIARHERPAAPPVPPPPSPSEPPTP